MLRFPGRICFSFFGWLFPFCLGRVEVRVSGQARA